MNLSVVVPLLNEEESLHELYARINKVCQENQLSYEIWFVDDGSTDSSWQIIENLSKENHHVHGIKFSRNYGKSQALHAAFEKVQGNWPMFTHYFNLCKFAFPEMAGRGDYSPPPKSITV